MDKLDKPANYHAPPCINMQAKDKAWLLLKVSPNC